MDLKFSEDFLTGVCLCLRICLLFCAKQGLWTGWREPLWKQVLWCTIFVTAAEFITGMIVNQWLDGMYGIIQEENGSCSVRSVCRLPLFFRTVRDRHSALRVSSLLVIRRRKPHFDFRKSEGGQNWIWYIELNFQKML